MRSRLDKEGGRGSAGSLTLQFCLGSVRLAAERAARNPNTCPRSPGSIEGIVCADDRLSALRDPKRAAFTSVCVVRNAPGARLAQGDPGRNLAVLHPAHVAGRLGGACA